MAHSLSAKKRIRQNATRRARNQVHMGLLKSQRRRLADALTAKDATVAEKEFVLLTKKLDQNAAKNKIHPNKAARTKSRLQKRLNALKGAAG